jgi:hypothetical protein
MHVNAFSESENTSQMTELLHSFEAAHKEDIETITQCQCSRCSACCYNDCL